MKNKIDESIYFDGNRTLTHNCILNYVIGARGCGKTFWFKKKAIKNFLKNGEQFAYVRRYDTELEGDFKATFFDDVKKYFPDHDIKVKGNIAYIDKKAMGFFMAISKGVTKKGSTFPNVSLVCFDEFIIDNKIYHYMNDEILHFFNLMSTILRDRTGNRIFCMSNAVTVSNPYFQQYGIAELNKEFTKVNDVTLIQYITNEKFTEHMQNTDIGKIAKGTVYESYGINNEFLLDDSSFIMKRTPKAYLKYNLYYMGNYIGVWVDYTVGKIFMSKSHDKSRITYVLTIDDHKPNTMVIKGKSTMLKELTTNFRMSNVYYENVNIKNICKKIFALLL